MWIHAEIRIWTDCLQNMDAIVNEGYGVFRGLEERVHLQYPPRMDVIVQNQGNAGDNEKSAEHQREYSVSFHHGRFIMNLRRRCLQQPRLPTQSWWRPIQRPPRAIPTC